MQAFFCFFPEIGAAFLHRQIEFYGDMTIIIWKGIYIWLEGLVSAEDRLKSLIKGIPAHCRIPFIIGSSE